MALSPQAQQILAEYQKYKETNIDRDVDRKKVQQVMKQEEQKAINTLFDNSRTIRGERHFQETFGDEQYQNQISRTGRTPANQREEQAIQNYGRVELSYPRGGTAVERFIDARQRETNIRAEREYRDQLFFGEQQAFTAEQLDDIEAAKIRIESQTKDLQTRIRTKEQFQKDSQKIREELQQLHRENNQRFAKRESYDDWRVLDRKWDNYWRARQPRYRGQALGAPPPMPASFWFANSKHSLRSDILFRDNLLRDYAREQTTFDNARGAVDTIRQELDRLAATQVLTPEVIVTIDAKIQEASRALETAAREKILKWTDGLQQLSLSILNAIQSKKSAIISNIPPPPARRPESVFETGDTINLNQAIEGGVLGLNNAIGDALSGLAAAFNPSPEDLKQSYVEMIKAQRSAMLQLQEEGQI